MATNTNQKLAVIQELLAEVSSYGIGDTIDLPLC